MDRRQKIVVASPVAGAPRRVLIANKAGMASQTVSNPTGQFNGTGHPSFAAGNNTQFDSWTRHLAVKTATGIRVWFQDVTAGANGRPQAGNPAATISCSIRPNCGGTGLTATAGTAGTDVLGVPVGGSAVCATDAKIAFDFPGLTLMEGTHFLLKRKWDFGGQVPTTIPTTNIPATGAFEYNGAGTDLPDRLEQSAYNPAGKFTAYNTLPPLAITGIPTAGYDFARIMILGASVFGEANDVAAQVDGSTLKGWTTKGLRTGYPWVQMSAAGRPASFIRSFSDAEKNRIFDWIAINGITAVLYGTWTNSILAGDSFATIRDDVVAIEGVIKDRRSYTILTTQPPLSNVAPSANTARVSADVVDPLNEWIRTEPFGKPIRDVNADWDNGSGLWRTDLGGVPTDPLNALVHPGQPLHDLEATIFTADAPRLFA